MQSSTRHLAGYGAVLSLALLAAIGASYTPLGRQIDNDVYDWLFRLSRPAPRQFESALLEIDETSFLKLGGVRALRSMLAGALERLSNYTPLVVVVDLTLADAGDPKEDAHLEEALSHTRNLVLAAEMLPRGEGWQEPLPRFARWADAVGHVHAAQDELDGVNRQVPLEKAAGHTRHWAMSLEAYRLSRGAASILESPEDLQIGSVIIPARRSDARAVYLRRLPTGPAGRTLIPRASVWEIHSNPAAGEIFRNRVVFIGVTAQSAARDRLMTPYSTEQPMPGVEIHANAFETLAAGHFLRPASEHQTALISAALVLAAGAAFWWLAGWAAYGAAAALVLAATALPYAYFSQDVVFPATGPVLAAWLASAAAASYQYFSARRRLRRAEAEKLRYQQAVHFVTHEMRTPLTAIQGSSELMARYPLGEEKRKQMAGLIFSESRRLARMIETFLNVERLSAGQMELKREPVAAGELVDACLARIRPLAERKQIQIEHASDAAAILLGDRELLEYAIYNLLSNAIKYSPAGTRVTVSGAFGGGNYRLSVRDQGIGMDRKELQNIFRRFYRTEKAIASGEAGTGIGLAIVEQIVTHHGGTIEVESEPGKGSCFTLVLPPASAPDVSNG